MVGPRKPPKGDQPIPIPRPQQENENVLTAHNDNSRTGAYRAEKILTPAAVLKRRMALLCALPVLGDISSQPRYVRNLKLKSGDQVDVIFVATDNAKLYAFRGDCSDTKPIWFVDLVCLDPDNDCTKGLTGKRPYPRPTGGYAGGGPSALGGGPVIDLRVGVTYVLFTTSNNNGSNLWAADPGGPYRSDVDMATWVVGLDIRTGALLRRVRVSGSVTGRNGTLSFNPQNQHHRPALLHVPDAGKKGEGTLYVAFGSRWEESKFNYHGWVMSYETPTLASRGVFCTTPDLTENGSGGGIWQGGGGLAADDEKNVYFQVGNAPYEVSDRSTSYGDSFVKLSAKLDRGRWILDAHSWAPPNANSFLNPNDLDLGSAGPLVVPGTGFVLGGGKTGDLYVLNRKTMSLVQSFTAFINQREPDWANHPNWANGPHLHGSPTFWRGPDKKFGYLYFWAEKDFLRLYRIDLATGRVEFSRDPTSGDPKPFRNGTVISPANVMPGGMLSVSSNGDREGTGVLWAQLSVSADGKCGGNPACLYAFNAETLDSLWHGHLTDPVTDAPLEGGKWLPPTIAQGRVYIGAGCGDKSWVFVYGLGIKSPPPPVAKNPFIPMPDPELTSLAQRFESEEQYNLLRRGAARAVATPRGQEVAFAARAEGVQIYTVQPAPDASQQLQWVLRGQEATLTDHRAAVVEARVAHLGKLSGNGFTGNDGSFATSEVMVSVDAPARGAIPWQLCRVLERRGSRLLAAVTYIQRINTDSGLPPAGQPPTAGVELRVPYLATYVFYRAMQPKEEDEERRRLRDRTPTRE
jgi:hypothetical protein